MKISNKFEVKKDSEQIFEKIAICITMGEQSRLWNVSESVACLVLTQSTSVY